MTWDLEGLSVALASALGVLREERLLRGREHGCIDKLRAGGAIR